VEGMIAFQVLFFVLDIKKETSDDISARRLLQTKKSLDNKLGLHIFSKF
jgi:hypothetical protein